MKIVQNIVRYAATMSVTGIICTLAATSYLKSNIYYFNAERILVERASAAIRLIDSNIHTGLIQAQFIARRPILVRFVLEQSASREASDRNLRDGSIPAPNLENMLTSLIWHISILDLQGELLKTTRPDTETTSAYGGIAQAVRARGIHMGNPFLDSAERLILMPIGVLIEDPENGSPIGVLLLELNWQDFADLLSTFYTQYDSGNVMLLDGTGRLFAHSDPRHIFRGFISLGLDPWLPRIRKSISGVLYISDSGSQVPELNNVALAYAHSTGEYEYSSNPGWVAAVTVDRHELRRDLLVNQGWDLLLSMALAFCLLIGVFLGTHRLMRPLESITAAIGRFGEDRSQILVEVDRSDELGALARTFRDMAQNLEDSEVELETKIQQLREANESLTEVARLKSQILSNVSHELRTPLHAIIGFVELSLPRVRDQIDVVDAANFDRVLRNAYQQLGLVEALLAYSRTESGRSDLHLETVAIQDLVTECSELVSYQLNQGVEVANVISPDFAIRADRIVLRQILVNMLSNAVKFTESGRIEVGVGARDTEVGIYVQDTGLGISQKNLSQIFEEFWQVDGSSVRRFGGTGLGLSIAKRMASELGGSISVTSILGEGSRFTLWLPHETPKAGGEGPKVPVEKDDEHKTPSDDHS